MMKTIECSEQSLNNFEDSIISYLSQGDFKPLLYTMIMLYIEELEKLDFDYAKEQIEKLKIKGYQLIDKKFANNEHITSNMLAFYAAMKAYEFDVRDYVLHLTKEEKTNNLPMSYYENCSIGFNIADMEIRRSESTATSFNYSMLYGIVHELRHAMQKKFLELYRTEFITGMDPNAIFYWILSIRLYRDDYECYREIEALFPHEYDAITYGCREILKDIEQYFPSVSTQYLYDKNCSIASYIYTLNDNIEKNSWCPSVQHFHGVYHKKRDVLSLTSKGIINEAIAIYSNTSFQDDAIKRFMRGEYSECLDILPHIKDGTLKTTNLFEVLDIFCRVRSKEEIPDEYSAESERAYQK